VLYFVEHKEWSLKRKCFPTGPQVYQTRDRRKTSPLKVGGELRLAIAVGLGVLFFFGFAGFVPAHAIHGDEVYYIGRSMQNLAFLEGHFPLDGVTTSHPNHPFAGELFIAIAMVAEGQTFPASVHVYGDSVYGIWNMSSAPLSWTDLTSGELNSARFMSLLIAAIALAALVYVGLQLSPLSGLFGFLFAVSAPGFIDTSLMAMLDIYSAAFTLLAIISLYWYLKGLRAALIASGAFLGLALGSKLAIDPLIAAVVIAFCVLVREEDNRARVKRIGQNWASAIISFAATSPVYVLRFTHEIAVSLSPVATRTGLAAWSQQSLLSTDNGIFGFIQSPVVVIYALVTSSALILFLYRWRTMSRSPRQDSSLIGRDGLVPVLRKNPETLFLIAALAFCSLDLLLSPLIFEWGRNFQRLDLYMALASSVSLAYLIRNLKWKRGKILFVGICFFVVMLTGGIFLGTLEARLAEGTFDYAASTIVMPSLVPGAGAVLIFSLAFAVIAVLAIFARSLAGTMFLQRAKGT